MRPCSFTLDSLYNIKENINQRLCQNYTHVSMIQVTSFLNQSVIKHLYIVQFCGTVVGERILKSDSVVYMKQQVTLKSLGWNLQ